MPSMDYLPPGYPSMYHSGWVPPTQPIVSFGVPVHVPQINTHTTIPNQVQQEPSRRYFSFLFLCTPCNFFCSREPPTWFKLTEEVDPFQIANYNIQPNLTLDFDDSIPAELTAKAELLEDSTSSVLYKGFQGGDIKPVAIHTTYDPFFLRKRFFL